MSRIHKILLGSAVACAAAFSNASGAIITLTDGNSTAAIDPLSQLGMDHWDVQGQNELAQQWFWYRVGSSGGEASINTLGTPVVTPFDGSSGVTVTYNSTAFSVSVRYLLTGGSLASAGQQTGADISETITITNNTASPLPFHFFQYSDFDLDGASNDTVTLSTLGSPARFVAADQSDGVTSTLTETVVTPKANHGEAAIFAATINELDDALPTTLNDNPGPTGPGDSTWALEWDFDGIGNDYAAIPGFGSQIISKQKSLDVVVQPSGSAPEPASLGLLGAGIMGMLLHRRRSRSD